MPKFFIEVPHESEQLACARAVQILFNTGSHFLTHADFGCNDGVHKAWIIIDVENKETARALIPANYRLQSTVVQLNKFSMEEIDELIKYHQGK